MSEVDRKEYSFQKLTPVKDGDIKIYSDALDFVFGEDDLKNIAITGPYSAGKSSVLETYKNSNSEKKFIHISLAHFEVVDEEEAKYDESVLEGKILNQLIHQVDSKNIPQTHFKIKRKPSKRSITINTMITMVFLGLLSYLIGFEKWEMYVSILNVSWFQFILALTVKNELISFAGAVIFGILSFWIYSFIRIQKERNLLRKVSFHGNEIEIFENTDESYFDKYLNEVLYVFQNANVDGIVFEDIDRFSNSKIFEKLREINFLLNKKSEKSIRFFYLLRDDIFTTKDRTKFFDFILPIVPVIDGSNSYDQFIEHFKKGGILEQFDEKFLQGLSLYIDDMRILKNIYNEFVIYHERIQLTELNSNKLLALITLKNLFPRDFSDLQLSRGFVYSLFSSKEEFIKKEITKIDSQIDSINPEIDKIEKENLVDIDELDAIFLLVGNGTFNVDGKNEKQFSSRTEFVKAMKQTPNSVTSSDRYNNFNVNINNELSQLSNKPEYVSRKKAIEEKAKNKISFYQTKIAELENSKHELMNRKLNEIINRENIKEIFGNIVVDEVGEQHLFNDVKSNPYFSLIKYLIRNGHIDETYPDYLTYFYANSLSRMNKIFLRSVSDQEAKDFAYELNDIELVVSRLRSADFSCEETLNFDLVEYLLSKEHGYLNILIQQLIKSKRFDFIWQFIEKSENSPQFIEKLHHRWTKIWSVIENEAVFNAEQKKLYMIYTIYHTADSDLLTLNSEDVLTQYLSSAPDFLNISNPDIERFILILELLNVKFSYIMFEAANKNLFKAVYESNFYELNFNMLKVILSKIYHENSEEAYKHSNFSVIFSKPQEPLFKYVDNNINQYFSIVLENCVELIKDNENSALYLINKTEIESEKKSMYIKYLVTILSNLCDVTDQSIWEELMNADKVKYSSKNIMEYFFNYSDMFDETLIKFINKGVENLTVNFDEMAEIYSEENVIEFIQKVMQCNDLLDMKYIMLLNSFSTPFESFEFIDIQKSKMKYLIEKNIVSMSKNNILLMREHYIELVDVFNIHNISEYVKLIDEETFVFDELIQILKSDLVDDELKLELLKITIEPISLLNEEFSDSVLMHIMGHNFDLEDISSLLLNYLKYSTEVQVSIDTLTGNNIEVIIDNQINMVFNHLLKIISSNDLTEQNRIDLFASQLSGLDKEQVIELLNIINAKDLLSLFSGKRPKFKKTTTHENILNIFMEKEWITNFKVDEHEPDYYRAFGRRYLNEH